MNDQAQASGKRKGLHPLVWVGIGCGGIVVMAAIVMMVLGLFVLKKGKDALEDLEKDPSKVAEWVVRANPDLELVKRDPEAGTITVRNVKTGEEVTVDWQDVKEGRITFSSGDQEVVFDADQDEGRVRITGDSGEDESFELSFGGESAVEVPEWVPLYPGTEPTGGATMTKAGGVSGGFGLETPDAADKVVEFYRERLAEDGYELSVNTFATGSETAGAIVSGTRNGRTVGVHISRGGDTTTIGVTFEEKAAE
jgi:hypothetical protein